MLKMFMNMSLPLRPQLKYSFKTCECEVRSNVKEKFHQPKIQVIVALL